MTEKNTDIIALSCSPSRGRNSDTMLDNFVKGINEYCNLSVEKIYLDDIPIENYNYENRKGPTDNEIKFKELTDKIQKSKGLIIATPTYNFNVPANLKNFIDRIRFFALDFTELKLGQPKGKLDYLSTFYLVSGGTPTWAQKIVFFAFPPFWLRSVFLYFGANCMGALYTGDTKVYENKRILKKCRNRGKRFARHIIKGKGNRPLEKIFWRPPQMD